MPCGVARQRGRLEMRLVIDHRLDRVVAREMMREREAHAHLRRQFRTVVAGAEQPDRRQRRIVGHRHHVVVGMARRKIAGLPQDQFVQPLEKIVALAAVEPAAQRMRGGAVGAWRAAKPEIDPAGKQRFQHLEALGHHQAARGWAASPRRSRRGYSWSPPRSARSSNRARGSRPTPDCGVRPASSGHSPARRRGAPGRCCCARPPPAWCLMVTTERSRIESGIMALT